MAGIIGAVGNNGVGVVGVNWHVRLMPCKIFDATGYGTLAAAIACLDYVAMMKDRGVNIVATNNSWGDDEFSASLRDAIDAQRQRGILFVAAAGNYSSALRPLQLPARHRQRPQADVAGELLPAEHHLGGELDQLRAAQRRLRPTAGARFTSPPPGTCILSTTPEQHLRLLHGHLDGRRRTSPAWRRCSRPQSPARDWKAIKNLILAGTEGDMFPDDDDADHAEAAECPRRPRVREQHGDLPAAAGPRVGARRWSDGRWSSPP